MVDRLVAPEVESLVEDFDDVRFLPKRIAPVAQNEQVSGQPDWDDRHSDRRPSR